MNKPYFIRNNPIHRFCYYIKHIKLACGILFGNCNTRISACGTKLFHQEQLMLYGTTTYNYQDCTRHYRFVSESLTMYFVMTAIFQDTVKHIETRKNTIGYVFENNLFSLTIIWCSYLNKQFLRSWLPNDIEIFLVAL